MIVRTSAALTRDLARAMRWCARQLALAGGSRVWCVRRRDTGLVVTFVAGSLEEVGTWIAFDGQPLDHYTLTPMEPDAEAGARFGMERDWRGGLHQ